MKGQEMTIFGLDISEYQDGLPLTNAAAAGIDFVIIRTTDGDYKDYCYASHYADAKRAGLAMAAYHFLRAPVEGSTIEQQVRASLQVMGDQRLPIWIDVESPRAQLAIEHVRECKRLYEAAGVTVAGVYTFAPYWYRMGNPSMDGLGALWLAAYPDQTPGLPALVYPGDTAATWSGQVGGRIPDIWQFTDNVRFGWWSAGQQGIDTNAFRGSREELAAILAGSSNQDTKESSMEKVLEYSPEGIGQDTGYFCGPATCQTIIKAATGATIEESFLARELGTHTGGTDYIGQFPTVLNRYLPGADYKHVDMPQDPPSSAQRERLWRDVTASIDAGYGVVANIVAPASNYPRAVGPSRTSPGYSGGTVYHYFAVVGYAGEGGSRRVKIADSGFTPHEYWLSFDQLATLIPPKGYAYSTATPKENTVNLFQSIADFIKGFVGPIGLDVKAIRRELTGGRDEGQYPGFRAEYLLANVRKKGYNGLTLVDMIALLIWGTDDDRAAARKVGEQVKP